MVNRRKLVAGTRFDCAATEHKGLTETGTNRVFGDWSLFWLAGGDWALKPVSTMQQQNTKD
ncbi:hypothetical protein CP371_08675 [Pediococcus acidilactici]|nr:hypothetical protein A4V11_05395 [Pediococcus acidilactici]MCQ0050799.1 hypothetical protein [Pediococcus acidilactici]MCQ0052648.1 hypothetical protein [Pediococcus acidilactici]MCQ0055435.1 hypothetical protein [Pediococcus acidilactici]MCQ0062160.1 hypothetical protein [Pediococcus acidilactici]